MIKHEWWNTVKRYLANIIIKDDPERGFNAYCPELQGCHVHGDTLEEAFKNIKEVIELHIIDRLECGEKIPLRVVKLQTLDVVPEFEKTPINCEVTIGIPSTISV